MAESVADELAVQNLPSNKNGPFGSTDQQDEASKNKSKDSKGVKAGRSPLEEKKVAKSQEEKRSRPQKMIEFQDIKISQVGSRGLFDEVVTCRLSSLKLKCFQFFANHNVFLLAGGIMRYI